MLSASKVKQITDAQLCLSRKRYGRGFQYFDCKGEKITNPKILKRLRKLVIPPMWEDVRICKSPFGHIQAIGRDGKNRKQYIYHEAWERQRQQEKFAKLKKFGRVLPALRRQAYKDLKGKNWTQEKVLALMILILDDTGIRIGNQCYADQNNTYGLSTLRRRHLQDEHSELLLEFKGKSNKHRQVTIDDPLLVKHIKIIAEQPGYEIFRYLDSNDSWTNVNSDEVNQYIRHYAGEIFSSKDFRTWTASRLAVELYSEARLISEEHPRKKIGNILVGLVAKELGNTKSVCRTYYIHPHVLNVIEQKQVPSLSRYKSSSSRYGHAASEKLLLRLLNQA